jgi:hypothetical protein
MLELPDDWQPLATISEDDWQLIEHLAALAGEAGEARGCVFSGHQIEAERVRSLLELGSDAILNIILHLAQYRLSDLVEALDIADFRYRLTDQILALSVANFKRRRMDQEQAWAAARSEPGVVLAWVEAMGAKSTRSDAQEQGRIRLAVAERLGLDPQQPTEPLQQAIGERLLELHQLG